MGKTLEKINLNIFFLLFFGKMVEKKNLNIFFSAFTLAPSYISEGTTNINIKRDVYTTGLARLEASHIATTPPTKCYQCLKSLWCYPLPMALDTWSKGGGLVH